MPARKTKTYTVVSGPGATTQASVPENPKRIGLFMQNTGGTLGIARFGGPTQGNGSDMQFSAGKDIKWDNPDTCPQESINVSSAAALTWCVIETVGP